MYHSHVTHYFHGSRLNSRRCVIACKKCYKKLEPIDGVGDYCRKCKGGRKKRELHPKSTRCSSCYCIINRHDNKHITIKKCAGCVQFDDLKRRREIIEINKRNDYSCDDYSCEPFCDQCQLKQSSGCCHCRDKRAYTYNRLYEGYLDGVGVYFGVKRHEHYCPSCRENCEIHCKK